MQSSMTQTNGSPEFPGRFTVRFETYVQIIYIPRMFKKIASHPKFYAISVICTVIGILNLAVDFISWLPFDEAYTWFFLGMGVAMLGMWITAIAVEEWEKRKTPTPVEINLGGGSVGPLTGKLEVGVGTLSYRERVKRKLQQFAIFNAIFSDKFLGK